MTSSSWEEYLTEVIAIFRAKVEKLEPERRKKVREVFHKCLLFEPCQIEVLNLKSEGFVIFFIGHDKSLSDMTFKVHEDAKSIDESIFLKKYEYTVFNDFGLSTFMNIGRQLNEHWIIAMENSVSVKEERTSQKLADYIFQDVEELLRTEQVGVIEQSTNGLKESIAKIPEEELRKELMAAIQKIDGASEEMRRIDKEIGGVRKMIGITKEFQDFRIFATDLEDLKRSHVHRDIFSAEIKRLDEKIEKGLEAINTRIEDLKAITFWSKRTLLEIALFIWGAIVTLYAAGVFQQFLQ